jgi:hypothetical protein
MNIKSPKKSKKNALKQKVVAVYKICVRKSDVLQLLQK